MKLSNLLQNPLNRKIDRAKVAEIKRAIKTSGVIKPLVYTEVMTDKGKENMLTDGHHRYVALKEMGYKDAPVVMSDERGIDTAQFQDMKTVKKAITALRSLSKHLQGIHKAKKPCREGYYRDKDGNCRRRGQRYGYGSGGILIRRPKHTKPHNGHNGHGTGNGGTPSNGGVTKHLQGQHDESSHGRRGGVRGAISREYRRKPKTRREATTRGAVKGGAVHLGTIAIPAIATAAIIRGATYFRFGVIGAGAALLIYEAPQFAFRVIEGSVREKKEFARQSRLKKAEAQTDRANRPISKGDHLLVMYKKGANIGVYIGDGKARLINGAKFEDVRTSKHNRLKIASGRGVPGIEQPNKTRRILRQVKREQTAINEAVKQIKEKQVTKRSITKHPGHPDQKVHGRRDKGKHETRQVKELRAQLRPAYRLGDKVYAGKRSQIHVQIFDKYPRLFEVSGKLISGFVDDKGKFYTRDEAMRRVGERMSEGMRGRTLRDTLEDLESNKVTKHTPGGQEHNQQRHDPTKGRGQGELGQSARSRLRGSSKFKQLRQELSSLASDPNKPGNKERMNEIQQQLAEQAREARGEIRREPKPAITSLSDVKNHLSLGTKVLLSAERSNLPTTQNTQRTAALREELRTIGSDIQESDSKYGGIQEKGFVFSISPKNLSTIKQLVQKYNQESVIVIKDGKAELRYADGRTEYADVSEATERVEAEDDYSSLGGVKFTIPFKDRRKELKRKVLKNVDTLRDLLTKTNRFTKEGVTATPVAGLELSREDLQSEMAHPHPGHVKKHTPGGQQHDQQSHAPKSARGGRATANLIQGIRPAIKYEGRILAGEKGDTHYAVRTSHADRPSYNDVEAGFVDARGDWMERDELASILGSGWGTSEDLLNEQEKLYNRSKVEKYLRGDYRSLAKDLAEEQERLSNLSKHLKGKHDESTHGRRGRGPATTGKSGFVTGFKNRAGNYVEIFRNPSKKDLRDVDSWSDEGAVRGMLTGDGDLIYWDARALHHEVRQELDLDEDTVPLLVGENYVYVTDNVRSSFGGGVTNPEHFKRNLLRSGNIIRRHKRKLAALIGEFQIDHYGANIDGNVIRQPYKKIRKVKNIGLSKLIAKEQKRKGWATQDDFSLSEKMDMDEGVNTKRPYKNVEGANVEGGRV